MTAKDELAALVADLDEATAAEVLAYARWLLEEAHLPAEETGAMGPGRSDWRCMLTLVIVVVLVICGAVSVLRWLGL